MPTCSVYSCTFSPLFRRCFSLGVLALAMQLSGCDKPYARVVSPRPVYVVRISAGDQAGQTLLTGEIAPHEETILSFRTDGRIVKRLTDVGKTVMPGDILAELDDADLRNQYRSAQAAVQEAQASFRLAAINLQRMAQLAPKGAISRSQLDEARTNRDTASAKLLSAQADLRNTRDRLGYSRLVSPVAGVVTSVSGSPGQVVSTGQEVLRLAEAGSRDAVFSAPASLLETMKQHPSLMLRLADAPDITVQGQLRDISPQADTQTRSWRVRYTLENPPDAMAMGATVTGILALDNRRFFSVPAQALTRNKQHPAVFVVDQQTKTLHLRDVEIASYTTSDVMVKQGLHPGDLVVTAGVSQLRDGEKVLLEAQE